MVASDHLESKPNLLPVAEEAFAAITESLSTFNASCERAFGVRSLSFKQVEHVALQTATVLAALRGYQNTLLPVSKLPPELLTRVFEFAASPSTIENYRQFQSQHSELADPVVNLARVCSSWRAIALASPQLWYHIIDTNNRSFQPKMFLQRSCTSDIHVYVSLPYGLLRKTHSVWPDIVRGHADRVRELHLFINRVTTMQDLLDFISAPLPSLEFLTMSAGGKRFFAPFDPPAEPPVILGATTLDIKAMILGPNTPFIPGNSFPSLVNLQLCGIECGVAATTNTLLDLLSNCPCVVTFELLTPIPDLGMLDAQATSRPRLALRYLKAIWMSKLSATSAFAFLAKLELPAVSTVRLTKLYAKDHPAYSAPPPLPLSHMGLTHLDILEGGKPAGRDTPFNLQFIAHGPDAGTGLWIDIHFWRPHRGGAGHCQSLSEQYAHEEGVFWDVLAPGVLPTHDVTALRMSTLSAAHLQRVEWMLIRGQLPALESLVVRNQKSGSAKGQTGAVNTLARALTPIEDPLGRERITAPRLGSLTIELNRAWNPGMGDLLLRALVEREQRGHPVRSVACSALSVGDSELAGRIREHVVGEVNVTTRKLWEMKKVPPVWMVKNDYWRLDPKSLARTGDSGWGLPENT